MNEDTYFAPGSRDSLAVIENEIELVVEGRFGQEVLDAIPDLAMILNDKRQIVAANEQTVGALGLSSSHQILGKRPGEALNCIHSADGPSGCGTSVSCRQCGAVKAILSCLQSKSSEQYECRITTRTEEFESSMEFIARANFFSLENTPFVLLVLRDISSEKRRDVLERLFFHDVLNTVGGVMGLADLVTTADPQESVEYLHLIHRLAEDIGEEITAHRNLLEAESGTLEVSLSEIPVDETLRHLVESFEHHPISVGKRFEIEKSQVQFVSSDRILLRRILGNMVKNALEAIPAGSLIKLSVKDDAGATVFSVNNPGFIPMRIQSQIFQRSFSTKGEPGRGLGTYSIRLFGERYLGGHVAFESTAEQGTTFTLALPRK